METETVRNVAANESNISITLETNSRGTNKKVHVYSAATKEEIDETCWKAVFAEQQLDSYIEEKGKLENYVKGGQK